MNVKDIEHAVLSKIGIDDWDSNLKARLKVAAITVFHLVMTPLHAIQGAWAHLKDAFGKELREAWNHNK